MVPPLKLSDKLTLDQVAALTDDEMVRRRFDAGNIRFAGAFATIAFFIAVIQALIALLSRHNTSPHLIPVALAHFVVASTGAAFFGELAWFERKAGRFKPRLPVHLIARNFTPWVIAFTIAEFTFLTLFRTPKSENWLGWAMGFAWLVVFLRLDLSRRLALHVSLLVVALLSTLILGSRTGQSAPEYMSAVMMNVFGFLAGAAASRRLRRTTMEEWVERRKQAREQVRMRDELEFARSVQLSMLPESAPSLDWLDIAASSLPATEVGGDYYDYFVDDGAVSIVCGDVAGHGLGSGIVLASLRSGFTLLRDSLDDPASVLQRLNDLVAQTSRTRMLATAAVLRIDRAARRATIASAGHPPLIRRTAAGMETIELFAPPLGVRLPYRVPARTVDISSGDVLVLHSDGVYETRNGAGEVYGLERLSRVIAESGLDAESIRDAILRDLAQFQNGAAQDDDVTLVVVRVI